MKNFFVIGDLMLDQYHVGSVSRISPEAPVQILDVENSYYTLGGAANVAHNLIELGSDSRVRLMGAVGNDENGSRLLKLLKQKSIDTSLVKIVEGRKTTTKTRFLAGQKQLLRVDYQQGDNVFESFLPNIPNETDVVIFSDYDYGVINREIINHVVSRHNTKVIADPKFANFWNYKDVWCFKPNKRECWSALCAMTSQASLELNEIDGTDTSVLIEEIRRIITSENILVTEGADGMTLHQKYSGYSKIEANALHVFDVTGAGDTVTSVLAYAVAEGYGIDAAAKLANQGAGKVVSQIGNGTVSFEDVINTEGE
tara:strand:+ start:1328 stop:2266 length:939 start_codon:yes stop_codon:yes gene_type:complete